MTVKQSQIRSTPEVVYFRIFLRAYFSESIRADYPPLPIDPIGWKKYAGRNIGKYAASGVPL